MTSLTVTLFQVNPCYQNVGLGFSESWFMCCLYCLCLHSANIYWSLLCLGLIAGKGLITRLGLLAQKPFWERLIVYTCNMNKPKEWFLPRFTVQWDIWELTFFRDLSFMLPNLFCPSCLFFIFLLDWASFLFSRFRLNHSWMPFCSEKVLL